MNVTILNHTYTRIHTHKYMHKCYVPPTHSEHCSQYLWMNWRHGISISEEKNTTNSRRFTCICSRCKRLPMRMVMDIHIDTKVCLKRSALSLFNCWWNSIPWASISNFSCYECDWTRSNNYENFREKCEIPNVIECETVQRIFLLVWRIRVVGHKCPITLRLHSHYRITITLSEPLAFANVCLVISDCTFLTKLVGNQMQASRLTPISRNLDSHSVCSFSVNIYKKGVWTNQLYILFLPVQSECAYVLCAFGIYCIKHVACDRSNVLWMCIWICPQFEPIETHDVKGMSRFVGLVTHACIFLFLGSSLSSSLGSPFSIAACLKRLLWYIRTYWRNGLSMMT